MNQVTVIKGYHYGSKNRHAYLFNRKAYYWKITPNTKHADRLKKDIAAIVQTRRGKRHVVVNDIQKVTGKTSVYFAKKLKPVIDIRDHGLVRMFKKWYEYDKKHNKLGN